MMLPLLVLSLFYYHLGLHYSQTDLSLTTTAKKFYYHLGLHYSQTRVAVRCVDFEFYYHLGLHYSQTERWSSPCFL